ncbi:MAG: hypothetical protein CMA62_02615 [Euryarchaeota archaeon]|nr:hypothetical protein [Euryarchaeota archaeon]MBT86396.1 hypothetical protein [Euryarchaeota archaeon]DAC46356.1 MAG TPA: hypothetical protein D7H82_04105 [Candidatus Poseidoniales archaeon]HII34061.1 hypothetical protein [Candidatus Thalassarchaeaceae archaeon]|tara:strand:- start:5941 stop:6414 length:474 start_codon:yes stop_codon:yes gene_type:complete
MDEHDGQIPLPSSPIEEKLLFLQENMVNFVNQYSQPIIEVSLVVSKYIRILLEKLQETASKSNETLPVELLTPRQLESVQESAVLDSFPLERVLESVDQDRMDILDTIIRTILNETELPFISALAILRDWEYNIRVQLSKSTSPGHLFSPIQLPEDF